MHHLTLTAALLAASAAPALAGDTVAVCMGLAQLAQTTMEVRQTGRPIHEVIGHMAGRVDDADQLNGVITLIELAYEEPLWGSADAKSEAAAEFSSLVYMACRAEAA